MFNRCHGPTAMCEYEDKSRTYTAAAYALSWTPANTGTGTSYSDKDKAAPPLVRHDFHGDWNHSLLPRDTPSRLDSISSRSLTRTTLACGPECVSVASKERFDRQP
jgi:hypothetical protein